MNKKTLSETDIRSKFITPAVCGPEGAGWDLMTQVREEAYFTKGRVVVRGKTVRRGEAKKADYLLYYKPNLPIAVIEAKEILARAFPVALTMREVTINQDMKALLPSEPKMKESLLLALRPFESDVLAAIEHSSHGTCKLETEFLQDFVMPLPPPAEQRRIVAKVDELTALVDALETQLAAARTTATALLAAALAELTRTPNGGKVSALSTPGRRGRPPKS